MRLACLHYDADCDECYTTLCQGQSNIPRVMRHLTPGCFRLLIQYPLDLPRSVGWDRQTPPYATLHIHTHTRTMIRRKVSTGLLRAAKSAPASNAAQAVSGSPMQQQSASLASAVLLNSQRNWKGETVVVLKGELKKRGLSQTGNK